MFRSSIYTLYHAQYLKLCQLFLIAVFVLVASPALAQQVPLKIVVFGDSLTSGYQLDPKASLPVMLERKLASRGYQVTFVNMSVAGETSTDALNRLSSVIAQAPDLVILEFGINDAMKGIDLKLITLKNLHQIINQLKNKDIGMLLCGTAPPANLSKADANFYTNMFYSLATTNNISLYPDILKGLEKRPDLTLADGLHPNEKGVLTIVQNMSPTLERLANWRVKYKAYRQNQQ